MGIIAIFIATCFASLANFFIRKNIESTGSSNGYLLCSFACSFLTLGLSFQKMYHTPISYGMLATGSIAGSLIFLLLKLTATALKYGPSGLTIAFQISGSIFPGLILYFVFGEPFGFALSSSLILGLLLVVMGLFWSASFEQMTFQSNRILWLILAISIFGIHLAFVSIVQARCLLFSDAPTHFLLFFRCQPEQDIWFMAGMLSTPFLLQLFIFFKTQQKPTSKELFFGSCGGLSSGIGTYFVLFATEAVDPNFRNLLFPIYSIGIIIFCNLWGQSYFKEKIHWQANLLSLFGIMIAAL